MALAQGVGSGSGGWTRGGLLWGVEAEEGPSQASRPWCSSSPQLPKLSDEEPRLGWAGGVAFDPGPLTPCVSGPGPAVSPR